MRKPALLTGGSNPPSKHDSPARGEIAIPLDDARGCGTAPCPVCNAPARRMAIHPQALLYRCGRCDHCFSSISEWEAYGPEYYAETHRKWFENPNTRLFERIARAIPNRAGLRVLDIGCGRGDLLRFLARRRPDLELFGIDLSENRSHPQITFLRGDVLETKIDGTFDVLVSLAAIEHIGAVRAFASRIVELCSPGGLVVVMTVNESSLLFFLARQFARMGFGLAFNGLYSRHHVNHFTSGSLRRLMEDAGLKVERTVFHNAPLKAMDIPKTDSALVNAGLHLCMYGIAAVGALTRTAYLQTVFCRGRP